MKIKMASHCLKEAHFKASPPTLESVHTPHPHPSPGVCTVVMVVVVISVVVVSSSPSGMKAVVVAEMCWPADPVSSGGGGRRGGAAAVEAGGVVRRKPVGGAAVVNGEGPVAAASEASGTIPPSKCWTGGWNGGSVEGLPPRTPRWQWWERKKEQGKGNQNG